MKTNIIKTMTLKLFSYLKFNHRTTNSSNSVENPSTENPVLKTDKPNKSKSSQKRIAKKPSSEEVTESGKIGQFLENHYVFRYNMLTEQTEYCKKIDKNKQIFTLLGERELNTICIEAQNTGLRCWDRDLARYVHSLFVSSYHPFKLFFSELPVWDGQDRLSDLASRVSKEEYWIRYFHRWMLAVTAQWMGIDKTHANSTAPLLISSTQGLQKSTFCKSLLPPALQNYYTDQLNLSANNLGNTLTQMGLINLDEFDRLSPNRMALLKNLMQMPSLTTRKAYKKHYSQLPRIASFIGTSNRKDLLTDPTGSRRFLCVEVEHTIDCTGINHNQIYAQLKTELQNGERYWFNTEEEKRIQAHNAAFYQSSPEEEIFRAHFRAVAENEKGELLSLADIIEILRTYHHGILHSINLAKFGSALVASGVERIHTHNGNRYHVIRIGEEREG